MRGVPLRVEIGPRDIEAGTVMVVRRDKQKGEDGAKTVVAFDALADAVTAQLDAVHVSLFEQAKAYLQSHTFRVTDRDEFFARCKNKDGMIDIAWCERPECEADVKTRTSATTRNTRPLEAGDTACVACGEPAKVRAYFAQSY